MSSIDQLAPEERAALMLIVQQGQSYENLAELLSSSADAVQARAHAALEHLGPDVSALLSSAERGEVADYLLGQQSFSQRSATRDLLARSPQARAWARTVSADLQPLTRDTLPEIPGAEVEPETHEREAVESAPAPAAPRARVAEPPTPRAPAAQPPRPRAPADEPPSAQTRERPPAAEVETAAGEPVRQPGWAPDRGRTPPIRRLGGLALIIAVGAAVVAAVVLLVTSSGSSKPKTTTTAPVVARTTSPSGSSGAGTTSGGAPKVHVVATIPLAAADGSAARGAAEIVQEQGSGARALLVAGSGLKPSGKSSAYAVWLYNSATDALSLGFFAQQVGTNGQLEGTAPLPANASNFHSIVITLETRAAPRHPGTIVLRGAFHT